MCSDATRPRLKIGKNFIFPRKTLENNFFRVQPGHIYHICGREEGFSAPPSFKLSLYPALPPPPPYPFPEEYDANIRQGRTEDLSFYLNSGVLILLLTFSLGLTGELSNLTKVFSRSSKRITSNVSFDVFLYLINTVM